MFKRTALYTYVIFISIKNIIIIKYIYTIFFTFHENKYKKFFIFHEKSVFVDEKPSAECRKVGKQDKLSSFFFKYRLH